MKAQSLQVNLPSGCNADCPFCIAKATWKTGVHDAGRIFGNLNRAFRFAKHHGVDSVMITSTGETTLNDGVGSIIHRAIRWNFPAVEVQTNGQRLASEPELLRGYVTSGLTGLAVSIASPDPVRNCEIIGVDFDYLQFMSHASEMGLLCRVALNMVEGEIDWELLREWAPELVARGVHQLTLREIGMPEFNSLDTEKSNDVRAWVLEHGLDTDNINMIETEVKENGHLVRQTPFGSDIYDYKGLSTCLARCMIENPHPDEIRAMILQPNGHVYSSWQLPGSILI